jgi:hypothetical protein
VSTADRSVFTLQRLYTLPIVLVPHVSRVCKALKHFRGEWLGVHYEAFRKECKRPTTSIVTDQGRRGGYMCEAGCTGLDIPDSFVLGTVRFAPNPRIFGNRLVGVSSVCAPLRVFGSTLQGLNQSIVGLSPLSETA